MDGLEALIQAAQYVEMQEQKQKQASPTNGGFSFNQVSLPSVTVAAPIHIKQESVLTSNALPTTITQLPSQQHTQQQITSTPHRTIRNSFDIINQLVIDEGGEVKRKQPPMVFRAGTREVHNKLEKHRRAHLKECFDQLKRQLSPTRDEKKTSNLNILHSAIKCIQTLKKKEIELEHEMERLAREKIAYQQQLTSLKKDVSLKCDTDFSALLPELSVDNAQVNTIQVQLPIIQEDVVIKEETDEIKMNGVIKCNESSAPTNELKITKSITKSLPIVTTNTTNGIKEGVLPQTTQVQTAALSVLPIGYPMNQGLVLQKVIVPKGITDITQLVSSQPVAHFIATPQPLGGKVVPLVNTQYVVKPLVVVSTPSRPS